MKVAGFELKAARVAKILRQFKKKRILVFGDVGVDKYTIGRVTRISPEAPIPVLEVVQNSLKLGLASNVADNVSALGGDPLLVGVIGKDLGAQYFRKLLRERKISDKYLISDKNRMTTLKERVVAENQQVVRIDYESLQKIDPKLTSAVWGKLEAAISKAHAVIIEDYAKGLIDSKLSRYLTDAAKAKGVPVLADPNLRSKPERYRGCTIITPNTIEAEALSGMTISDTASLKRAGAKILEDVQAMFVIITRGREGMAVFSRESKEPVLIPTFAREVFDVSGAGDTVIATLALALVSGADIIEATLLSNLAAGVEVGKRGTATVTVEEIKDYIDFVAASRPKK